MTARHRTNRFGFGLGAALVLLLLVPLASCKTDRRIESRPARPVLQLGPEKPRRVAFSRELGDHRLLVVSASGVVSLWDLATLSRPERVATLPAIAYDARFAAGADEIVTASKDGTLRWWASDGTLLRTSQGAHEGAVRSVAVSDEVIASAGDDGLIRLWGVDGSPLGEPLRGHRGMVLSVAVSPSGDLASFGIDETVRSWIRVKPGTPADDAGPTYSAGPVYEVSTPRLTAMLPNLIALDVNWGWGFQVGFSAEGDAFAAAPFDRTVRLRKRGSNDPLTLTGESRHQVQTLAFSPTRDLLATASHDGTLQLWSLEGIPIGEPIPAHNGPTLSVDFSADNRILATAGSDDMVRFWSVAGRWLGELPSGTPGDIGALAFAPGGDSFAAATRTSEVGIWTLDGKLSGEIKAGKGAVQALAFAPRGKLVATAGVDAMVRLWERDGRSAVRPWRASPSGVFSIAFSPAGDLLATGALNVGVRLWTIDGKPQGRPLGGLRDRIEDVAFSPDGMLVAAASADSEIGIWRVDRSWESGAILVHGGYVNAVSFSPDGDFLVSTGRDGTVRLFNPDGSPRGDPLRGHNGAGTALAFSSSGGLASAGEDGTVRFWDLGTRRSEELFVGFAIRDVGFLGDTGVLDDEGFLGDTLWVRTQDGQILFYRPDGTLSASMRIEWGSAVVYTPDGWYSGYGDLMRRLRLFRDGKPLDRREVEDRRSSDKVLAAIRGR